MLRWWDAKEILWVETFERPWHRANQSATTWKLGKICANATKPVKSTKFQINFSPRKLQGKYCSPFGLVNVVSQRKAKVDDVFFFWFNYFQIVNALCPKLWADIFLIWMPTICLPDHWFLFFRFLSFPSWYFSSFDCWTCWNVGFVGFKP